MDHPEAETCASRTLVLDFNSLTKVSCFRNNASKNKGKLQKMQFVFSPKLTFKVRYYCTILSYLFLSLTLSSINQVSLDLRFIEGQ
jgi:hypothetical protein